MVGVRVSGSRTITATGESELLAVPEGYVAFLKRLSVSNGAMALATVQVVFYNGTSSKAVLTLKVASGATVVLGEDELPLEGCPTKIAVSTDQQPIIVDYTVELE
jgi:hypothetical protein